MFPAAIPFSWLRRRSAIPNICPNRCGRLHTSRKRTTLRAGSPLRASHDERAMKMNYRSLWFLPVLIISTVLYGQGRGPAAFNIDVTGYWTPPLHEDALERGNGP